MEKPRIVLCNKIDIEGAYDHAVELTEKIRSEEPDTVVIPVSVATGRGMKEARLEIERLVNSQEKRLVVQETESSSFGNSFMASRAVMDEDDDENVQYPGSEG